MKRLHPVALALPLALTVAHAVMAAFPSDVREETKNIITLPQSGIPVAVDASASLERYADAVVLGGSFMGWGVGVVEQSPTVYVKRVGDRLYVRYDNPLKEGQRPTMTGATMDNAGIAMGNAIEFFAMPVKRTQSDLGKYIQFLGNARGAIYDALSQS